MRKAEEVLHSRVWNGRNFRYSLKSYVHAHRDVYEELVLARDHINHQIPNPRTRVTNLLTSIQANHISPITAAKVHIEADPNMREDFEAASDFLILNVPKHQPSDNRNQRNISAFRRNGNRQNKWTNELKDEFQVLKDRRVTVPDGLRYYKDYRTFSREQKRLLQLMRIKENAKEGGDKTKPTEDEAPKQSESSRKYIAKLKRKIAALE